jgi:RNA polymerase sigma factor (TIGR02999 family)
MKQVRPDVPDEAASALLAQSYEEVRRVAHRIIASDSQRKVMQATELAHEAILRLIAINRIEIRGQAHLLALAAQSMRRVLIDEARKGAAAKRRMPDMVTCWPDGGAADRLVGIEDLDRALVALERVSPDHAQVVELRFMLGLTVEEASQASNVPARTIKRRWQTARAWLLDFLNPDVGGDGAEGIGVGGVGEDAGAGAGAGGAHGDD